jgi:ABC-2 type transport system permease protein
MTDLLIETPPSDPALAGRNPGMVVAGWVSRRAGRSGALWGLVFGFFIIVQTHAYTSTYKTRASRVQVARAYGSDVAMNALIGSERGVTTVAGWVDWRFAGILGVLGCVWGLLTSTRLLRGEEEAGRYDLLLAGQTTRRRAAGQAVAGLGVGLLALFALTALGAIVTGRSASVGFSIGQCLLLSVALVSGAAMFLAIGALASQLAITRRRAASMAGVIFGIMYALRMVADTNPGLHWLVWLSPLGWIEESRPLTGLNFVALLLVLVLVIAVTAVTLHLAGTRDLGAATMSERGSAKAHLVLVGSPAGLAVRLMRPVALGWLVAVAAFAVLIGTTAESGTKDTSGSRGILQAIGRLGGHGSLVTDYLGLTFLMLALLVALMAAGQITAVRTEEADGQLENLLVRPLHRISWFAGRLGLSTLLVIVAGVVAGVGTWAGAASQHSGVRFGSLVTAGLNVVPPALFLLGLGALVIGMWPGRTSTVVYGYLAWAFLVEFAGGLVHTSHWLLDTSVFFHMVPAPATDPDWSSAAVMTGLGVLGAVLGGFLLHRRDLRGA